MFVPHLQRLSQMIQPQDREYWLKHALAWLLKCDVLFRLPGESNGAEEEECVAVFEGIPVVKSHTEVVKLCDDESAVPREVERLRRMISNQRVTICELQRNEEKLAARAESLENENKNFKEEIQQFRRD